MTKRECNLRQARLYECPAEDSISEQPLTLKERFSAVKLNGQARRGREEHACLPDVIHLFVGMKVMVTFNVMTEVDVANGA